MSQMNPKSSVRAPGESERPSKTLLLVSSTLTDEGSIILIFEMRFSVSYQSLFTPASYEEIEIFMQKILEKVVNGDTKTVTIADVNDAFGDPEYIMEGIINISPSPVRVEETNTRVFEHRFDSPGTRTAHFGSICDIVISL